MISLWRNPFCSTLELLKKSGPKLMAVLIIAICANAAIPAQSEKIDQYIRAGMEVRHIPGLALVAHMAFSPATAPQGQDLLALEAQVGG
jgi:hypothetical protein